MPWKGPHWSPRNQATCRGHLGDKRPAKTQKDTATQTPLRNWNTYSFPVGVTVEDNQGLKSLFAIMARVQCGRALPLTHRVTSNSPELLWMCPCVENEQTEIETPKVLLGPIVHDSMFGE